MDSGINVNVHSLLYFLSQNILQGLLQTHTHTHTDLEILIWKDWVLNQRPTQREVQMVGGQTIRTGRDREKGPSSEPHIWDLPEQ